LMRVFDAMYFSLFSKCVEYQVDWLYFLLAVR
jgi:hypothetical protein